jgi:hypothetical protein
MNRNGFGLSLEAMCYMLVILIFTSVCIVQASTFNESARISKAQTDASALGGFISEYNTEIGEYPDSLAVLTQAKGQYGPWILKVPTDPWENTYRYQKTDTQFVVYSLGPDKSDSGSSPQNGVANGDIGYQGR